MDFQKFKNLKNLLSLGKKPATTQEGDDGSTISASATATAVQKRDPRKAIKFFEHAHTVADTRNYDYAIDLFISGLRHDPDNLREHEALRDAAVRRKVAKGKPAPMTEQLKPGGPTAVDKMLHAEKIWAMNPLDPKLMVRIMKHAVTAHNDPQEPANLGEIAFWIGEQALEFNLKAKKESKSLYLELVDYFGQVNRWDRAKDAMLQVIRLEPNNPAHGATMQSIEAERMMQEGGYSQSTQETDYRKNLKDPEKQRALQIDRSYASEESQVHEQIERRRAEWEEAPEDYDRLLILIDAMLKLPRKELEDEAISLLQQAYEETSQYRFRVRVGDIRIRQFSRFLQQIKEQLRQEPTNAELQAKFEAGTKKRLLFELQEFEERVQNYPTDNTLKYELGRRLFQVGRIDQAIGSLQQAKADPKVRDNANLLLGQCYLRKAWYDEAISTLTQGLAEHHRPQDRSYLDMTYQLMDAHETLARKESTLANAQEAQKLASTILQQNIQYRDIAQRMDGLKQLVASLKA